MVYLPEVLTGSSCGAASQGQADGHDDGHGDANDSSDGDADYQSEPAAAATRRLREGNERECESYLRVTVLRNQCDQGL